MKAVDVRREQMPCQCTGENARFASSVRHLSAGFSILTSTYDTISPAGDKQTEPVDRFHHLNVAPSGLVENRIRKLYNI